MGRLTEGVPVIPVQRGSLVTSALHRERISPDEIFSEMHKAGLERLEQVKWGVLEPDGRISFVPWETGGQPAAGSGHPQKLSRAPHG